MAEVDNIVRLETGAPYEEVARAQLTGATSTYSSVKFGNVISYMVTVEGTNSMTYTTSGKVITITGTNDDFVNIKLVGNK